MESPFFSSHWNPASRHRFSPNVRGVPVKTQRTSSPKVVAIPVRFVQSDRTPSTSALKIQKVFRGFLVRKSMKKIEAIKSEVDEIERRISKKEIVDLIRRDSKERLKVNETLMALLFRLDSVRGVDSGVRDCRKAVIRRAIALQEAVDAIIAGDQTLAANNGTDTKDEAPEVNDCGHFSENVVDLPDRAEAAPNSSESDTVPEVAEETLEPQVFANELTEEILKPQNPNENSDEAAVVLVKSPPQVYENMEVSDADDLVDSGASANAEICVTGETFELHNTEPSRCGDPKESIKTSQSENDLSQLSANPHSDDDSSSTKGDDKMEVSQPEQKIERNSMSDIGVGERDDNKRNKELLDKMMEDNEKLMGLMMELLEKNEMQTRMLNSLSLRVEQLERASICERLRRKKKKKHVSGTVECPPRKTPDSKN